MKLKTLKDLRPTTNVGIEVTAVAYAIWEGNGQCMLHWIGDPGTPHALVLADREGWEVLLLYRLDV